MTHVRHRLRAGLGLLAAVGILVGGGTVATADSIDAIDAYLSDVDVAPWAYAFTAVQPAVEVSGTQVPVGARVGFELFDGPGAQTCDPVDSLGYAFVPAAVGVVSEPYYYPYSTGWLGWKAVLQTSEGTVLAETACATTEVRSFFTDVPGDHPFFSQIHLLGLSGVAEGYQPGPQFRPAQAQSRQGMAAFLQRYLMDGDPAPECTEAPFSDVPVDHPFCGEISWLKGQGFIDGYGDGTFRPTAPVSRQAGATVIARARGMEEGLTCTEALFTDVPADHPFCGAIAWLDDDMGVRGYEDGSFRPGAPMTRQAMAAWLVEGLGMPMPEAQTRAPAAGAEAWSNES